MTAPSDHKFNAEGIPKGWRWVDPEASTKQPIKYETAAGTLGRRIPAMIASGELEARAGIPLAPESAHVMLCGNSAMITDVSEELAKRAMRRHRRREPGHITTEKYH